MARAAKPSPLAKLSPPRTPRALERPRLFAALDRALESRGVWIAGRPGAGKTTLVSTYCDARKRTARWYQLDARDADPANVFRHLGGMTFSASPRGKARAHPHPPEFTPDARRDMEAFARQFFRAYFASAKCPLTLVFDNAHEAASPDLHRMFAAALAEAPPGVTIIVISRDETPAELTGALASRTLARLDAGLLDLTEGEAVALAGVVGSDDRDAALAIHRRVGGWPAGIVLLAHARAGPAGTTHPPSGIEGIFDYFAAEVFDDLDAETRRVLLTTAWLPDFSAAVAVAISGVPEAERAIDRCYRRHLFVEWREVSTPRGDHERRYQFHPLFADFLRARGRATFPVAALADLRRHAIALMADAGQADAAIAASLAAGELSTARGLLAREAPQMLRLGRHPQLLTWIEAADPQRLDPWLGYWTGLAYTHSDQKQARQKLKHAFDAFVAGNDTPGQLLAAAAMLDAIHSAWSTFEGLDEWLAVAERLYRALPERPDPATELRALNGIVPGVALLRPRDPQLIADAERLFELIEMEGDVNDRMSAALCLLHLAEALRHSEWRPRIERMVERLLMRSELTPRKRAEWWFMASINRMALGNADLVAAREIAMTHGFNDLLTRIACTEAGTVLAYGQDLAVAEGLLRDAERWLDPARPFAVQEYHGMQARFAALRYRDGDAVIAHCELAIAAARRAHAPKPILTFARQLLPTGHLLRGDYAAAVAAAEETANGAFPWQSAMQNMVADMIRAYAALVQRLPERDALLKRALRQARELDLPFFLQSTRREAALICVAALEAGIEVEFVRHAIQQRKLMPPPGSPRVWPWPVRLHAFGALTIERDGAPIAVSGKAQKKPLELIRVLIAAGGGPVNATDVGALLWPDAEGDAAATALRVNLHRARRMLGHDDAFVLEDGKLALNPETVWLDLRAFGQCVEAMERAATGNDDAGLSETSADLLSLYRGPLLRDDGDAAWLLPARARACDALMRAVTRGGASYERRSKWPEAIALYERGIDAEPLAEELYRGLMRCHAAQGRTADALRAYRRCREMLSILLGIAPSAATEKLVREIHGQSAR